MAELRQILDKPILYFISSTKKALVFFNISFSIRSRFTSWRKATSSAFSSALNRLSFCACSCCCFHKYNWLLRIVYPTRLPPPHAVTLLRHSCDGFDFELTAVALISTFFTHRHLDSWLYYPISKCLVSLDQNTPASRASFSQLFAGNERVVASMREALQAKLKPTERIRSLDEDLATVRQALQRSGRFMGLAALLSVVLAGAAVALTTSSLLRREQTAVAVLKALGMSRRQVLLDQGFSLLLTALFAAAVGGAVGFVLQFGLAAWLGNVVGNELPAPDFLPALVGLLTAVVLLVGFALPPLLRLLDTSPMQILQGGVVVSKPWLVLLCLVAAVFGLLWLQAQDVALAAMLLLALAVGIGLFWAAAQGLLRLTRYLRQGAGWAWLPALGHSHRATLLLVVFASGLFALLLLTTVRTDLLNRWQAALPADAPDHFLINIQPQEVEPLQQFLQTQGVQASLYPMIRGRLVEINGKPIKVEDYANPQARRLLEREFNLSSFAAFPTSNVLLQGKWFAGENAGLSIEQKIGEDLHFGLGDVLTFDVAGQRISQPVTSVREVKWDSMQPNFFVVAAPGSLMGLPQTFITSIHLGENKTLVTQLVKQFPSVTAIDMGAIVVQVRALITQASLAVQGIFAFTLLAGVVVLIAALQSQKAERHREIAILKSLGAGRSVLRQRIWGEFLLIGGLAGILAGLLAMAVGNALGYFLFDLPLGFNLSPVLWGASAGAVLVGGAGYANLRRLLDVLPLTLLKS